MSIPGNKNTQQFTSTFEVIKTVLPWQITGAGTATMDTETPIHVYEGLSRSCIQFKWRLFLNWKII